MRGSLHERWDATLFEEFRFKDDPGDLFLHQAEVGLAYKASNWLNLGLNYRQVYEKKEGDWKGRTGPM